MTQRTSLRARPLFWVGVIVLALAVAGGGYGTWYLFLKSSGPPPVDISNVPVPTVSPATATGTLPSSPTAAASAGTPAAASGATTGSIDGTWKVDPSLEVFVGYRVQEQLASIGANTAVGRTSDVTGSLTVQGSSVTAAEFTADLTGLKSDDDRRDGQLRNQGIQTGQFPNATFRLTSPIDLGSVPADGATIAVIVTGDFTLHGVTKSVEIPLQAKRSADVIVVTGSLPIVFADYNIQRPNSFAVLSIDDHGTMEFQLLFTKS